MWLIATQYVDTAKSSNKLEVKCVLNFPIKLTLLVRLVNKRMDVDRVCLIHNYKVN